MVGSVKGCRTYTPQGSHTTSGVVLTEESLGVVQLQRGRCRQGFVVEALDVLFGKTGVVFKVHIFVGEVSVEGSNLVSDLHPSQTCPTECLETSTP